SFRSLLVFLDSCFLLGFFCFLCSSVSKVLRLAKGQRPTAKGPSLITRQQYSLARTMFRQAILIPPDSDRSPGKKGSPYEKTPSSPRLPGAADSMPNRPGQEEFYQRLSADH